MVRVFSSSEQRWAPAEQIQAYEGQVASTALPAQQVGDVKKSDLPGPEALSEPGLQHFVCHLVPIEICGDLRQKVRRSEDDQKWRPS